MKARIAEKPFKVFDLIVYAAIAVITVSLFVAVAASRRTGDEAEVTLRGETVMKIDLASQKVEIIDSERVVSLGSDEYEITSAGGYNRIKIDFVAKTVRVVESDCAGGECKGMDLTSGAIICAPHGLVIRISGAHSPPRVG